MRAKSYGKDQISERHRHRYEYNNDYRERFEKAGLIVCGESPDGMLVEMVELHNHPWFVGVQFHPGVQVAAGRPAPAVPGFCGREA